MGTETGGGMGWAQIAVLAASTAMQGIGAWLGGGSGENRKPFQGTTYSGQMGDREASYIGDMMRGMVEDARHRGFAKVTPRIDFDMPTGYTRTAPLVLGYSGREYTAGGSDRGIYAATQTRPGLGAPWAEQHRREEEAESLAAFEKDEAARAEWVKTQEEHGTDEADRDPYVSTYKGLGSPGTFVGGRQIRTAVSPMMAQRNTTGGGTGPPDGAGRNEGRGGRGTTVWINGEEVTTYGDEMMAGGGANAAAGYDTTGAGSGYSAHVAPAQEQAEQASAGYQSSGGQYGERYEEVKALRDSVAQRGKLERGSPGNPGRAESV